MLKPELQTEKFSERNLEKVSKRLSTDLRFHIFLNGVAGISKLDPAIALFLPPPFLQVIENLSQFIHDQVLTLARDSHIYQRPWVLTEVQKHLEREVSRYLMKDLKFSFWLDVVSKDQEIQIRPRLEEQKWDQSCHETVLLQIQHQGQIDVMELALSEFPQVREWLAHWIYGEEVPRTKSKKMEELEKKINALEGFDTEPFQPGQSTQSSRQNSELQVTHLGHAGLMVESSGNRLLFDPLFFAPEPDFFVQPWHPLQMGKIDGVFITHHHSDHLDLGSLLLLPLETPLFVPAHKGQWFEPKYLSLLQLFGFENVTELEPGDIQKWSQGLSVEALPFFGEGRDILQFAGLCYHIAQNGHNILLHADAGPDSKNRSLLDSGVIEDLVHRYGPIETIFGTWWQSQIFLHQHSALAILMENVTSSDWLKATEACHCSVEFLTKLIQACSAKRMVFYAEAGRDKFLPREKQSAYVSTVSHYWKSVDKVCREVSQKTGAQVIEARPFQRY